MAQSPVLGQSWPQRASLLAGEAAFAIMNKHSQRTEQLIGDDCKSHYQARHSLPSTRLKKGESEVYFPTPSVEATHSLHLIFVVDGRYIYLRTRWRLTGWCQMFMLTKTANLLLMLWYSDFLMEHGGKGSSRLCTLVISICQLLALPQHLPRPQCQGCRYHRSSISMIFSSLRVQSNLWNRGAPMTTI